jgi:hypothetical protein
VTLGFIAGSSYEELAHAVGRGAAAVVGVVVIVILGVWQVRKHRTAAKPTAD